MRAPKPIFRPWGFFPTLNENSIFVIFGLTTSNRTDVIACLSGVGDVKSEWAM